MKSKKEEVYIANKDFATLINNKEIKLVKGEIVKGLSKPFIISLVNDNLIKLKNGIK